WGGEYGAAGARPDTETLPVLRGPTPDCADRHIRGSMRRLRRDGASGAQHGACGGEMEQEEGRRFLITALQAFVSRMLKATFSGYATPRPAPSAVCPSVAF